jgi:hypothetical protein
MLKVSSKRRQCSGETGFTGCTRFAFRFRDASIFPIRASASKQNRVASRHDLEFLLAHSWIIVVCAERRLSRAITVKRKKGWSESKPSLTRYWNTGRKPTFLLGHADPDRSGFQDA